MLLEVDVHEGARLAVLRGELDMSSVGTLVCAIRPLTAGGGDLDIDMEAVRFVDSTGLQGLLSLAEMLGPDGRVRIVRPRRALCRLLHVSGLGARFELVDPEPPCG
jgi:anti-anti-sigma factor